MKTLRTAAATMLGTFLFGANAGAIFVTPQSAPVDRLLRKAEAYRAAHPQDAEAHYTLARVHYLAFSRGARMIPAFREAENEEKPELPGNWMIDLSLYEVRQQRAHELALKDLGERGPRVPPEKASAFEEARGRRARQLEAQNWRPRGDLPAPETIAHAAAALSGFREAARLDPANGLYPLGLASLAEEFSEWATGRRDLPPELRALNPATARAAYLQAFRLAFPREGGLPALPASGIASLVSYEAGHGFLRLAERRGAKPSPAEKAARKEIEAGLGKLRAIPLGAITPIVFALRPAARLAPLLAPQARVDFDLRGFGPRARWPWVQPTTAFLVWDPEARGAITSARQLFGSYTFEIFRADGYAALAALDDDGDGALRGEELRGIRAWFDTNSDGRSAPAEVRDLCALGIVAIATRSTAQDGPHPSHPHGLTLRDGSTLPTWDWIAEPVRE